MTASPSPYQIKAFTFAARERSISNAAEALGVTQSSVTQHISKLEMLMGTQLFIRRRSGLELTRAGRELFAVSDRLATMEQLVSEKISDYSALTDGHIRLIANAPRPAMPIIAQYGRLHPKVQIDFTLYNWTTAMTLLGERQVDIAIVTEPDEGQSIVTHELRRSRYMAHIQKDHPLAGRQKSRSLIFSARLWFCPKTAPSRRRSPAQNCATMAWSSPGYCARQPFQW